MNTPHSTTAPQATPPDPAPIRDAACWHCGRPFETRVPHRGLCPPCERLADGDTRVTRIEGLTVTLYPNAISAFLRAGDAAPAHEWWEGVPLPESTEDDRTAARRYTATRRAP